MVNLILFSIRCILCPMHSDKHFMCIIHDLVLTVEQPIGGGAAISSVWVGKYRL